MRLGYRFALGFFIGCILFVWSFILAGAGHGSNVPLASVDPFLLMIQIFSNLGLLGLLLMISGSGLLWAFYFGAVAGINSFAVRMLLVVLIAVVHIGSALWALVYDFLLTDSFKRFPVLTGGYFIFFCIALLSLGVLTWVGPKRRPSTMVS